MPNEASKVIDSWLMLQCKLLAGAVRSVALLGEPDQGPYRPVASWPKAAATTPGLSNAAASALHQRRIVVRDKESAPAAAKFVDGSRVRRFFRMGPIIGANRYRLE